MANIMITDQCNLHCPYCFANEFVNKTTNEISIENFEKALDFIVRDGSIHRVGLIGGEPTLHSRFETILSRVLVDDRVEQVVLYTNGLLLQKYPDLITHPKMRYLINCNSPCDMGERRYNQLIDNLDWLICKKLIHKEVTLGINLYKPDLDYGYIIDLLRKYNLHDVRMSVTVPNIEEQKNRNAHDYFRQMKALVNHFIKDLAQNRIIPTYDCNKIPSCIIPPVTKELYGDLLQVPEMKERYDESNIHDGFVRCSPSIDIRQDLTAVRCFGLSQYTKQKIEDFKNISELAAFYARTIDFYAFNTSYSLKCTNCHLRHVLVCSGGCLAFKIGQIMNMQKYSEEITNSCSSESALFSWVTSFIQQ